MRNRVVTQRRREDSARKAHANLARNIEEEVVDPIETAEYRAALIHRATQLMRTEFEETTWRAFWKCVVEDRPVPEVARDLRLSVGAVYVAKSRVLHRLREDLNGLLD